MIRAGHTVTDGFRMVAARDLFGSAVFGGNLDDGLDQA
jgi:hypothetical protein